MRSSRLPGPMALAASLVVLAGANEARSELLPDASVHLEAARYEPSEPDLQWTGWIGASAGLVRLERVTVALTADVETILGNVRRPFDATQVNYHLEPALRRPLGAVEATLFFHHVSRHAVDREKRQAVDWNVLGVRAMGPLSRSVRVSGGVGHTTLASLVGYRWELTAGCDADFVRPAYLRGSLRLVTVRRTEAFPRGDFVDVTVEAGTRWRRLAQVLETFAAFERRNDVLLLRPAVQNRLLLGFRIRRDSQ